MFVNVFIYTIFIFSFIGDINLLHTMQLLVLCKLKHGKQMTYFKVNVCKVMIKILVFEYQGIDTSMLHHKIIAKISEDLD